MSDLPPNNPDFYIQQDKINNPPIEHRLLEYPKMSREVGEVIITIKDGVATITKKAEKKQVSDETKQETQELSEKRKAEFIERLKKLSDYEGSKVQEAIENRTIEIKKIPGRNLFAIYESRAGNLVYITKINGEKYFNLDKVRNGALRGALEVGYKKISGVEEKSENGLYNLYRGDNKVDISSDEYIIIVLRSVDMILDFEKNLDEEIKRREQL